MMEQERVSAILAFFSFVFFRFAIFHVLFFLCVFAFFSKYFRGSADRKILVFFWGGGWGGSLFFWQKKNKVWGVRVRRVGPRGF